MKTVNSASGVSGQAHIKVENSKVKMILKYKEGDEEEEVKKILAKEDCPPWIANGTWRVKVNGAMDKMYSAVPWNGSVTVKSLGVSHKKDEEPTPFTSAGKFGPYSQYVIKWEVVDGPFKGMEVSQFMSYDVYVPVAAEVNGKKVTIVAVKYNKSKPSKGYLQNAQLDDAFGFWDENKPMAWADNILPKIHKRLLKTAEDGLLATLQLFEGNVASVEKYQSGDAWDGEEETKSDETSSPVTEPDPEEHEVDEAEPADDDSQGEIDWNS